MNLIKCSTLELYLGKLGGGEIKDVDLVFVEDVQEIYVGGQPYGKDPVWNEQTPLDRIEIGDYITKSGRVVKFVDYQDTDRDNLAGIYIGYSPSSGEKLFIPANVGFEYNSSQGGLKFWNETNIPENIHNNINLLDITNQSNEVSVKFNGKSQTEKILAAAAANGKPSTYFGVANFCKSFAPGFHDGDWYLPSVGELLLMQEPYSDIIEQSITNIYPDVMHFSGRYWSSNQYYKDIFWDVTIVSGSLGFSFVDYNELFVVPFLAIE